MYMFIAASDDYLHVRGRNKKILRVTVGVAHLVH